MSIFVIGFWLLCLICAVVFFKSKQLVKFSTDDNFKKFQRAYLAVYLLATAGDWLQGPYIYALYKQYGFSTFEINKLFVAGYGSSLLFGTIVGSMADKYGRKKNCLLYGLFYIASCLTKHFPNYTILFLGRILSGIATSILCSAFESWMICEHYQKKFDKDSVPITFSQITFGNSLVAITSGVSAQFFVDKFGFVAPYDVASIVFGVMLVSIICLWNENYGNENVEFSKSFKNALQAVISGHMLLLHAVYFIQSLAYCSFSRRFIHELFQRDKKIQCLGIVQSLFEGSMYIFVLEWTPSLTPKRNADVANDTSTQYSDGHRGQIPHGYIFASFMVSVTIGSMLFKISCQYMKPEIFLRYILAIASACFLFVILFGEVQIAAYTSFVMFELCVGAFWPCIGTLRSEYIPEQYRAAIMCLFRVPLNIIVIVILTQDFLISSVFSCCFIFLVISTVIQSIFIRILDSNLTQQVEILPSIKCPPLIKT